VKAELDPQAQVDPATQAAWPPPQKAGPPPGFPRAPAEQEPAPQETAQAATPSPPPETETPPEKGSTTAKGVRTASATATRKSRDGEQATASKQEGAAGTAKTAKSARVQEEAVPEPVTTVTQEDMAEVLDTSTPKGAAKAGLGWLTLRTVPRAAVFDGATQLGTTPLEKMPLPVGTYTLRVLDPTDEEATSRRLSAPIRPGEVTKLQIRLADLPLYKEE